MKSYTGRGVHGNTVEILGARIVSGGLAPGQTLDLNAIGAELDVSLTALREAIKVLTAKGLLDARQKRGTFVRPRTDWNVLDADVIRWRHASGESGALLKDLAEVRAAIEPSAAAVAARRRQENEVEDLRAALQAMEDAVDGTAAQMAEADLRFHQALLRATGNELFARMSVFVEPALALRDELVHGHAVEDPVPSHRRVVDAIAEGDPEAATDAVRALLEQSVADAARVLEEEGRGA
ncbi:FadR/GntR family transcriptional regulator [Sediminivirga luteola]|uniref:GntR family transcriptional regulator n=1 Tax=Sediminivirga luteola TaxID=1774748 RepID=A0A8J2TW28_9MICO|nr:FadR/GntR family transcriptional regulator [Sediminivirga luteola]MCI2264415.1 FadR family transcriptional regulator [Sediminivirga luteola]GGA06022.1 GntR family transcriptional regulator [Sediminivirga luteola]